MWYIYPYNGLLFSHKMEWSTDTYYNRDKPWKHYANSKKSDSKGHTLYNSNMKCPDKKISWRFIAGGWVKGRIGTDCQPQSGVIKMFWNSG